MIPTLTLITITRSEVRTLAVRDDQALKTPALSFILPYNDEHHVRQFLSENADTIAEIQAKASLGAHRDGTLRWSTTALGAVEALERACRAY